MTHPPIRHHAAAPLRAAGLLLALGCAAQASWAQDNEANPYYIGASQGFTRESNLFKTPDGAPRTSDTYSSTGLLAGIDQPFGRQRFYANGNVRENRYRDTTLLNNTSYGLNAGLDWSTIERLSGSLHLGRNQSLADYGTAGAPLLTSRNIQKSEQLGATVRYGLTARTALRGGLERRDVSFSAPAFADRQYDQKVVSAGVSHQFSGLLTVGVGVRRSQNQYVNDESRRRDLDFTADWVPSGLSTVNARLSASRERRSVLKQSDFNGTTGSLNWTYRPTGKLSFQTSVARDTGTELNFLEFTPTGETLRSEDVNRVGTRVQLGVSYEATAKIRLNGSASRVRSRVVNNSSGGSGGETTNTYSLQATYQALRTVTLGCNAGRQSRSALSGASDYHSNTVGCSAELRFQ